MPKKHRISHTEHESLRKTPSRRLVGEYASISYTKQSSNMLFACVVSKKIARKAIDRNLIKRRFRAIFSQILPQIPGHYSFIVYPKKIALKASFQDLQRDILGLLNAL